MVPQFKSQTDFINHVRTLNSATNYSALLADQFQLIAPNDASMHQKEYLYKYLLQGTFQGLNGQQLIDYAAKKTEKFVVEFPWVLQKYEQNQPSETKTVKPKRVVKRPRIVNENMPDGAIVYIEHRDTWVGYMDGKIRVARKTEAECQRFFKKKYGI